MKYNVARERIKFFAEQEKLAKQYRTAGMTEDQIKLLFDYDYEMFKKERVFREHNNFVDMSTFDGGQVAEENYSNIEKYMEKFTVELENIKLSGRFGWIEEIEHQKLYATLKKLSKKDVKLVTMYIFEGYTLADIAKIWGVSPQAVGKRMRRVKKFLKNIF